MPEHLVTPSEQDLLRKYLFMPCETKEHLHDWIQVYLGIDIPDSLVDKESNCSMLGMIWECYNKARLNDDPEFNRVLYFAARDSGKTLAAAIIEVLSVLHLDRNVAHMAAIEAQGRKAQSYVKKFLDRPILREFKVGDNAREIIIVRYFNPQTGDSIPQNQWNELPTPAEQDLYHKIENYIKIVICTMSGANSEHVPLFVVDEVDVVENPRAYEEAKMIPAAMEGKMPITILTSTRKFSIGLVQKEIDEAERSGLKIRHWNMIDVTEACPPARHLPEEPKIPIFVNEDTLSAISKEDYERLSGPEQEKFDEKEGFAGCLKNCSLFAQCQGRLATHQKSKSKFLKPIQHTINQFRTVSISSAQAQLLCKKPSTEGLIYQYLEPDLHKKTAAEMYAEVTGEDEPAQMTKRQLIDALNRIEGGKWCVGMDFGFTHNFAGVLAFIYGDRAFVIDVILQSGLDPAQRIEVCQARYGELHPLIYADPAEPGMIKMMRKSGFSMKDWKKEKGSVLAGIEIVRMKIRPAISSPKLFFLKGDEEVDDLFKDLSRYHWKLQPDGRLSKEPDEERDDGPDALRYLIMNVFAPKGKFAFSASPVEAKDPFKGSDNNGQYKPNEWMSRVISEHLGGSGSNPAEPSESGVVVKKGRFNFSI